MRETREQQPLSFGMYVTARKRIAWLRSTNVSSIFLLRWSVMVAWKTDSESPCWIWNWWKSVQGAACNVCLLSRSLSPSNAWLHWISVLKIIPGASQSTVRPYRYMVSYHVLTISLTLFKNTNRRPSRVLGAWEKKVRGTDAAEANFQLPVLRSGLNWMMTTTWTWLPWATLTFCFDIWKRYTLDILVPQRETHFEYPADQSFADT